MKREILNNDIKKSIAKTHKYSKQSYNALKALSEIEQESVDGNFIQQDFYKIITQKPKTISAKQIMRYVAVMVGVFAVSLFVFKTGTSDSGYKSYQTAKNQTSMIYLEDGSEIFLREASVLKVSKEFSAKNREMIFEKGNAFFNIHHDPSAPLSLKTKDVDVTVLGTTFNIKQDLDFNFSLNQGKVELDFKNLQNKKMVLTNNQNVIYYANSNQIAYSEFSEHTYVNWLKNKLVFENVKLKDIVKDLRLYYEKKIVLVDQQAGEYRFNGVFENKTPIEILKSFSHIYDFEVKEYSSYIKITKK